MANTYTQLYIQVVFAVKGRQNLIHESFREELQKYMTGTAQNRGHKMLAIYCMPDHTHLFFGLNPDESISKCVGEIKGNASKWINENNKVRGHFSWQRGFGAFSYSRSHIDNVVKYINNQAEHHRKKSFKEEYFEFLEKFAVDFDERYVFDWIDDDGGH